MDGGIFDLKEEIRNYWSKRSETFDLAFGHRIAPGTGSKGLAVAVKTRLVAGLAKDRFQLTFFRCGFSSPGTRRL